MTSTTMTDDEVREHTLKQTRAYLDLLRAQDWDAWVDLWADDAVLEFPFVPHGGTSVYRGKDDILEYMKGTTESVVVDGVADLQIFPAANPEQIIVELEIKGHIISTGADYPQRYVTVFEYADGLIKHYREYWNPLVAVEAMGEWPASWYPEGKRPTT